MPSTSLEMHRNRFRPGLRSPGPHWGSLQRSLRPLASGEGARRVLPRTAPPPRPFGLRPYRLCCVVPQHPRKYILVTALRQAPENWHRSLARLGNVLEFTQAIGWKLPETDQRRIIYRLRGNLLGRLHQLANA